MTDNTCICGKPTGSTASLCTDCRTTLEKAIANVSAYYVDLVTTLRGRLVRFGTANGRSNEKPLGMDARFAKVGRASEVEWVTRNTVSTWVRVIQEATHGAAQGPLCDPYGRCAHNSCVGVWRSRPPRDTIPSMCRYLTRWADWLRVSPFGPEALDELCDVERQLRQVIDRPADRWFAGPCSAKLEDDALCDEPLYAKAESGEVVCSECTATYDVAERRAWLLASAENYEAPATVIARAITAWGESESSAGQLAARIRQWGSRNRIFPVRHEYIDGVQRPLYRIGVVLDLLAEDARHAEEKRLRRGAQAS